MKNQNENPTGKKHTSKSEVIKTLKGESIDLSSKSMDDFRKENKLGNLINKYNSKNNRVKDRIRNIQSTLNNNDLDEKDQRNLFDTITDLIDEGTIYEMILGDLKSLKK